MKNLLLILLCIFYVIVITSGAFNFPKSNGELVQYNYYSLSYMGEMEHEQSDFLL